MFDRRDFLRLSAATAAGLALGPPLRAEVARADLKFIFLIVHGGWDPTRVFTDTFDSPQISMEADAERAELGDLMWVSHPDRPAVDDFFEAWAANCLVVNGIVVPSVSHADCTQLALTGSNIEAAGDWPVLIAQAAQDRFALPHTIVHGPNVPGNYASMVTRIGSNGYVEGLLSGELITRSDVRLPPLDAEIAALVERQALAQAAARAPDAAVFETLASADVRAQVVEGLVDEVRWGRDLALTSQAVQAVDFLRLGMSRCVTIADDDRTWDSHELNDEKQSVMFQGLFTALNALMDELATTPGQAADTLAEETVVVLMSEMGRTPFLNSGRGKDHWGHTSSLIVGPGFATGRTVGGFSDLFYGAPVDRTSGALTESGVALHAKLFGATLLAAADVDPAPLLRGEEPVEGWLG
ncbi:MAG: DUF1501 domain-containing protein [Alphaproteobacteria bacterium]|nr:DUF1501 domain-containing protein [Alphaproteobacteria bacterium]